MANAFTLFGEIKLDTSQLNSGLSQAETRIGKTKAALDGLEGSANRAGTGVTSFGSSASSSGNAVGTFTGKLQAASGKLDSIGGAFLAAGASLTAAFTVPLTGLAYAAVNTSKDLQSLEMGLTAVTGSADEAKKQMAQLKEVAKLPGLGMKEALQGAINLQATGLSAETSQRALKAFGNALATVGKGKADLQGVITALSQIQSKGKVSAEEINQIAERVPQIRKVMQGAFGTTEGKELEKRKVGTEQFIKGVITELEKLPPVATSAQGEFENFADAVDAALKPLGDAILPILVGAMQKLQPVIQSISETFAGLSPEMQTIILAVGAIVAAIGPLLVIIGTLAMSISAIITLGEVLIPVFAAVGGTLTASFLPVIATIAAVVAAGYLLYQAYQTNFAGIKDLVDGAMSAVVDTFNAAKQVILDFWAKNGSAIMKAYNTIKDAVGKIIKAVEPYAKVLIDIFANQVVVVWNIVKSVFGYIYDVISSFVMFFVDIVNGDWKSAGADLVNFFLAPINLLLSVLANLYDLVTYPFRKLLDWLKGFLPEWAQKAIGIGESMIDGVSDTMKKGIPKIDAAAYRAGEAVPNGITQGVQGGADAANQATANFINGVGDIVEENGKKVVAIADATGKSLQGSLDKLAANTELSPELRKKLKAEADKIGEDLAKSLSDADKKALAGSQRLINTLNELLKNPNLSQGLKDAITTELNRLNTAMNDAGKRLGTDVVAGFVQGVRDRKENIFTVGNDLGQTAIKGAKTGLKSQSPSKVFEAIGFDVVQGFVNGINNNKQLAQVAANALLDVEKFAKKGKNKGERAALEALAELINENKRLETVGIANLTILEMTDAKFKGVTAATIKRIIAEKELKAAIENRLSTEERVKGILEEVIKSAYPQELSNLDKVKQALSDLAKANGIVEQSIKQRAIRAAIALDLEKQLATIAEKGLVLKPSVNAGQIGGGLIGEEDPTLPPPLYKDAWDEFSRTVRDRIRRAYSDLPSFGEFFQTSILDSLSRVGDIFVDAVNNWDGTLGGFFKNVAIGFGKMIQQILADLARLAIQRLVLQLLSSIGASVGGGTITSAQAAAQGVDLSFPDFSGIGLSPTMGGAIGNAPTMGMMPSLAGVTNNSSSSVTNNNVNVNVSGAVGNNQQTGQMIQKQVIAALRKTERRTR